MQDAGRATLLADDRPLLAPDVEALASAYLDAADGKPSLALRLAAADRVSDLDRLHARVAELQALVSRGFARGAGLMASARDTLREARDRGAAIDARRRRGRGNNRTCVLNFALHEIVLRAYR